MTQRERQMSGRLFDARDKDLMEIKYRAHALCREYNTLDERDPRRTEILKELLGGHGEKFMMQDPIRFNYGCNTKVGENFFSNFGLTVLDDGPITIGDNVMLAPNVSLLCSSHPLLAKERTALTYPDGHTSMSEYAPPIVIGNDVWIAGGVIVTGGVVIGDGAVIGAGSVVTKNIPAGWFACGVPCRPIRPITKEDSKMDMM